MKPGVLMGVAIALFAGGYFGYEWWKEEQAKKKHAAQTKAIAEQPMDAGVAAIEPLEMPNLNGLTADEAKAMLIKLGFKAGTFRVLPGYECSYVHEKDMRPRGHICNQDPPAGANVSPSRKIEVTVEQDDYEAGSIGTVSEWKRMPELVGMSINSARSKLRGLGFTDEEFQIDEEQGCGPIGTVCETEPVGLGRKVRGRKGTIVVGE